MHNHGTAKTARVTSHYDATLREHVIQILLEDRENNGPLRRAGFSR